MEDLIFNLQENYQTIMQAVCAEEVFGDLSADSPLDQLARLEQVNGQIFKAVNPDNFEDNLDTKEMAKEAYGMLKLFYARAQDKIKNCVYGEKIKDLARGPGTLIKTKIREYLIDKALAEGDITTIYQGECIGGTEFAGRVIAKIIEDPVDNDLLRNEIKVLKLFMEEPGMQNKHLPVLLDQFRTSREQMGTILRFIDAQDLYALRKGKYKKGFPQFHTAWILERSLSALGFAHSKGILHNNLEPAHVLVRLKDHNVFLIDWCYAAVKPSISGDGFKVFNEDYSPPEAEKKLPPLPSSDLFSLGKCMIYLLGGDIKTDEMPETVDERFQRFVRFMVRESPIQRAQDAWEMHGILVALRKEIFGSKGFVEIRV